MPCVPHTVAYRKPHTVYVAPQVPHPAASPTYHPCHRFRIELRADGHFHCPSYPGHFSYKLNSEASTVAIEWGKYGSYDSTPDPNPNPRP